jgi:hypothetical protein
MTHRGRGTRILLATILALSAAAIALSVWAVSLLERMVYYPYPPNECAVVGAYLLYGRRAIGAASEGIPLDTVNGCARAAAPYEMPTAIIVWTSAGFDVLAVLAILVLVVVRHRMVKADRAEQVARTGVAFPRQRVTRIAWIGLGLSVLAVALLILTGWLFNAELSFSAGNPGPDLGGLWLVSFLVMALAFIAGIVVNVLAGRRGWANRLVGIVSGLIMLAPAALLVVSFLLSPLGIFWP